MLSAVLLAVSCGGRNASEETSDAQEEAVAETPASKPALPDSASLRKNLSTLPEEPFFDITTSMGTIRVKLYKDTPKHRDNFIKLSLSHFYDNILFHRVIDGFIIQGGDPFTRDTSRVAEWGDGGPGYEIPAEFVPEHTHKKGALAAARRGDLANPMKESSGSQFYLVQDAAACKHLDGAYTVFGEAVAGLSVIDRIAHVATDRYDRPLNPVVIKSVRPNAEMNKRALADGVPALEGVSVDLSNVNIPQKDTTADGREMVTTRKNGHVITRIKK